VLLARCAESASLLAVSATVEVTALGVTTVVFSSPDVALTVTVLPLVCTEVLVDVGTDASDVEAGRSRVMQVCWLETDVEMADVGAAAALSASSAMTPVYRDIDGSGSNGRVVDNGFANDCGREGWRGERRKEDTTHKVRIRTVAHSNPLLCRPLFIAVSSRYETELHYTSLYRSPTE